MPSDAAALAERLLDAQVDFVLAELTGDRLDAQLADLVDDVLAVAATCRLADVLDVGTVQATAHRLIATIAASPIVAELMPALADAIYDSAAGDEHLLGDVVPREPVEALIVKLLAMQQLHDRALDRLTESPLVASIASSYVTKLVGDFLQQNREQAEKVPGVSSLFSIGLGAASKVKGVTDKRLGGFLGDAQTRSTQFAIRRTNGAMREMIRDAPVAEAAMEMWDLHAGEPIGRLREYLSAQDLHDLLAIVHEIVTTARDAEYVSAVVDECVEVVFDRYGSRDVASLLTELGLTRDLIVEDARRFAPLVDAARADGRLAALVRARLAPFFLADSTLAILAG